MQKPNILFLLADDQRHRTIHALGNKEILTPNLDRLVHQGCSFTNAHIMGGTNGAVCMPSRAMLFTGRTLFHIENEGQNIPPEHTTLGEAFKNEGYSTCGIGKWHNGTQSYARSFTCGGNIFFGGMWDHWNVPVCDYHEDGEYNHMIRYTSNFYYGNQTMEMHCDRISAGVHSTELMASEAIRYLENYTEEKPFYLQVSFLAPHDPRTMPDKYKNMYRPVELTLPPDFSEEFDVDFGIGSMRDEVLAGYPRSESEIRQHLADYYAMISHLDDAVGRILSALERSGKLENTIIVYAADNGLAVGSHGFMGKQNLYEDSVRVPLIISGSGIPEGKTVDQYVYLSDIFPTLCQLCDVEIPASVEGKSMLPVIENGQAIHDSLYLAYEGKVRAVKKAPYKLIEYRTDKMRRTQLFDMEKDPYEQDDLSEEEGLAEVRRSLALLLEDYNEKLDDCRHRIGREFWKNYRKTEER